jgi:hypothetical protein
MELINMADIFFCWNRGKIGFRSLPYCVIKLIRINKNGPHFLEISVISLAYGVMNIVMAAFRLGIYGHISPRSEIKLIKMTFIRVEEWTIG